MRVAYWIAPVAALAAALPTNPSNPSAARDHLRLPRDSFLHLADDPNPPIVIPDVPPGTELATDPLTGYKGYITSGLNRFIEGVQWLTETLAVFRGERDEPRGGSPASGNGS